MQKPALKKSAPHATLPEGDFFIKKTIKGSVPKHPYQKIHEAVLGTNYNLSLVFVGEAFSRSLNHKYRLKDKAANVLSFPITDNDGEIFICPAVARKQADSYGQTYNDFIAYLFIHGLFHLKGLDHGSTMEGAEKKILQKFGY